MNQDLKEKTALNWFYDKMIDLDFEAEFHVHCDIYEIYSEAKEKMKKQIIKAFNDGYCKGSLGLKNEDIEKYFKDNYKL
jgi:uncharacterized UBP type Zn finger protein